MAKQDAKQPEEVITTKEVPTVEMKEVFVPGIPDVEAAIAYVISANLPTSRERHGAFVYQMASKGWRYGPVADANTKKHPWVRNWLQLPPTDRAEQATVFVAPTPTETKE